MKTKYKRIKPSIDLFKFKKADLHHKPNPIEYKIDMKYIENNQNKEIVEKLTLLTENKYRPSQYMAHSFL